MTTATQARRALLERILRDQVTRHGVAGIREICDVLRELVQDEIDLALVQHGEEGDERVKWEAVLGGVDALDCECEMVE